MDNCFITRMKEDKKFVVDLLRPLSVGERFGYDIDKAFFERIDGMIDDGCLTTEVEFLGCSAGVFKFSVHSEGTVKVPCDRCMSDVELRIDTTDELCAKLGAEYSDEGDCVVVPENEGELDLSLLIYEFIVLSMPIRCVHEPGMCDDTVMELLSEHQVARSNQDGGSEVDSDSTDAGDVVDERWAALKKLINK